MRLRRAGAAVSSINPVAMVNGESASMGRKPNLFVIGAMKSGTTTLCRYLSEHPAIYMSPDKEPGHFSHRENWSRYLRLFDGASNERYLAEGSTHYTKRPFMDGVAARIHQFNADARLVYIMRDPFARLVSQYRDRIKRLQERRSLIQAIGERSDYLAYSYYAYQLKPYLELFGRQAIHLDTFESMTADPRAFLGRLFDWLGVDASFVPSVAGKRHNASPEVLEIIDVGSLRGRLWRAIRSHRRIVRLVPPAARRWYKRLVPRQSVRHADSDEFRQEVDRIRERVQPLLADWIFELRELTGRSYEEWPSARATAQRDHQVLPDEEVWLPEDILRAYRGTPAIRQDCRGTHS